MQGLNAAKVALVVLGVCASQGYAISNPYTPINCDLFGEHETSACVLGQPNSLSNYVYPYVCQVCPPGMFACNNAYFNATVGCSFLNDTTSEYCGECGNRCSGDTPVCVGGKCGCDVSDAYSRRACGTDKFCDLAEQKCTECPADTASCSFNDNEGKVGDCETFLLNSTQHCGACGHSCGAGQTCVGGVCKCGALVGECPFDKPYCSDGECVACISEFGSDCRKTSIFDEVSGYCNKATKECKTCKSDFADCDISGNNGTATDCETNIKPTGKSSNCGACGLTCGTSNTAQSCCAGTCKCGKYKDNANPTPDECTAATQCSSTEYCDEVLEMCMPLFPGNEVCNQNAISPADSTNKNSLKECGSCDREVSRSNIVNGTCRAFDNEVCGADEEKCRPGQVCMNGKCVCDSMLYWSDPGDVYSSKFYAANAFVAEDPDGDNKYDYEGTPAGGCSMASATDISARMNGWYRRVQQNLFGFVHCLEKANLTNVDRFTPADFANKEFRDKACPGTEGLCATGFCDALYYNATGTNRNGFCNIANYYAAEAKRCVTEYRIHNQPGDLTCANNFARVAIVSNPTKFSPLDAYNFLGCDKPHDDMIVKFKGDKPASFMYRVETGKLLLGGGMVNQVSAALTGFVLLCVMTFVAF